MVVSSSGGEGEARLFDGAYTAGEIFLTSTTLQLKAKAKRPLYLGKAATSGTIENVRASAPAPKRWGQVCIASRGKVKKLCIEVISSENTTIAVVFYHALEFNK